MSNPDNDNGKLSTGLVKSIPMPIPANLRTGDMLPTMKASMDDFNFNTEHVVRISNLGLPTVKGGLMEIEDKCRHALKIVLDLMEAAPNIRAKQIPVTIIDGTVMSEVVPYDWSWDIRYVNLFWNHQRNPVIVVAIGLRKHISVQHHYWLEDEESQRIVVFDYDPLTNGYGVVGRIQRAIVNNTNYHLLDQFGTVFQKALKGTANPEREFPVAAASYHHDKIWYVPRPCRHSHIVHSTEYHEALDVSGDDIYVQGFLTNHGNMVTRYRAMYQAIKNRTMRAQEQIAVTWTHSLLKERYFMERGMGGILYQEDMESGEGYRIVTTALFSEDLW